LVEGVYLEARPIEAPPIKTLERKMSAKFGMKIGLGAALVAGVLFGFGMTSAQAQGFKRTMLQTTAFPGGQYVTALYVVDIDAGAAVPPHTQSWARDALYPRR
jgi:hypothetical protein